RAMREIDSSHELSRQASSRLFEAFIGRARQAIADMDTAAAETWIDEADGLAVDAEIVGAVRDELRAKLIQAESARLVPASSLEMDEAHSGRVGAASAGFVPRDGVVYGSRVPGPRARARARRLGRRRVRGDEGRQNARRRGDGCIAFVVFPPGGRRRGRAMAVPAADLHGRADRAARVYAYPLR